MKNKEYIELLREIQVISHDLVCIVRNPVPNLILNQRILGHFWRINDKLEEARQEAEKQEQCLVDHNGLLNMSDRPNKYCYNCGAYLFNQ